MHRLTGHWLWSSFWVALTAGALAAGCVRKTAPLPAKPPDAATPPPPAATPPGAVPTPPPPRPGDPEGGSPPLEHTATEAAEALMTFLALAGVKDRQLVKATHRSPFFEVKLRIGRGEAARELRYWMTEDLEWFALGLTHIDRRAELLRDERAFADCLVRRGLQIFIGKDPKDDEATRKMLSAIGVFAWDAVIDCRDARGALCERLEVHNTPLVRWKGGEEVGGASRGWLLDKSGCPRPRHLAVVAPDEVDRDELGERVVLLQSRAATSPVELVSVRRDGQVWIVMVVIRGKEDTMVRVVVSRDGKHAMQSPLHIPTARRGMETRRRFAACLKAAQTRIFVSSKDEESMRWLRAIGPEVGRLAIDCATDAGKPACARAEVTRFPSVIVKGFSLPPPLNRLTLEAATGCK